MSLNVSSHVLGAKLQSVLLLQKSFYMFLYFKLYLSVLMLVIKIKNCLV